MNKEPIDYNSPLGISKREWTRVLGVNLALLLLIYAIALICTLCGSDFFLLNFHSDDLQRIEDTLRGWNCFALVQIAFKTIETTVIGIFAVMKRPRIWMPIATFALLCFVNICFTQGLGYYPPFVPNIVMVFIWVATCLLSNRKDGKRFLISLGRAGIGLALSLVFSLAVSYFRLSYAKMFNVELSNSAGFVLSVEYLLALVLSLIFLSLLINWEPRKGGKETCPTNPGVSGSCPTTTKNSPKSTRNTKRNLNNLPPKLRKRIRLLKAKTIAIQTSALIVVSLLPIVSGRGVEYALVFASFSLTRLCLGLIHSLHFKSEAMCVSVAGLMFWALCFLTPSVEACLIMSMVYGGAVALAFRLYWELHDLLLYRYVSKFDRYAMFYVAFKGDTSPRHILGVMMSKGYGKEDVTMVTLYMERVKVEGIALDLNYSKRVIEDRLTNLANELYSSR